MKEINRVCVAGAGSMGRQIAVNASMAGYAVSVKTSKPESNYDWCKSFLDKGVSKGKYTAEQAAQALARIVFYTTTEEAVKDADLIIESVVEDETAKRAFFVEANKYAAKDALLTSNSSYIPSSAYIEQVDDPSRLANLHYFNPVMNMKLVEIAHGEHTSPETLEALKAFVASLGKEAIVVHKEIEGFVVNRLLRAVQDEAYYLYGQGIASFQDIDTAAEKGLNYPMGPFRLVDFTGIDINYLNRLRAYEKSHLEEDKPPEFLAEKYRKGEFGRKTGKGWYDYNK